MEATQNERDVVLEQGRGPRRICLTGGKEGIRMEEQRRRKEMLEQGGKRG